MILPDVYWADTYFGDDNVPDKALCVQGEGRRNKTSTGLATGGGDIISV